MQRQTKFPSQAQLILPLLEVLDEMGGRGRPQDVAEALADKFGLSHEARTRRVCAGRAGHVNEWQRHVRWARQQAVLRGLVKSPEVGIWELTEKAKKDLRNIRPGLVITIFETDKGIALWAEVEAALGYIENDSVNLCFTSPPYPLVRKKEYGNLDAKSYVDWLVDVASGIYEKLAEDGSFVLNLGDVWRKGSPTLSLYQERLLLRLVDDVGFHLAERFYWENPSKMPSPAQWVTIERIRVTPSVEQVFWLSKTERPKANNRNVLREYSDSMKKVLEAGGQRRQERPSGYVISDGGFSKDNGGSIPHNLLIIANTASNDQYARRCKEAGLPRHPARFPPALPEFFIRFLTDEGDVVFEPFGGSGTTAEVAERLGRRWIMTEKSLTYLQGASFRLDRFPGFRWLLSEARPNALAA